MQIQHFAVQFACAYAIADPEAKFRTSGNACERIDIATTRAQFGNLCANPRSVAKSNFGIREKREPWIGAPYRIGTISHDLSPVREHRNSASPLYRTTVRHIQAFVSSGSPKEITGCAYGWPSEGRKSPEGAIRNTRCRFEEPMPKPLPCCIAGAEYRNACRRDSRTKRHRFCAGCGTKLGTVPCFGEVRRSCY